jgi:hypothetical protein
VGSGGRWDHGFAKPTAHDRQYGRATFCDGRRCSARLRWHDEPGCCRRAEHLRAIALMQSSSSLYHDVVFPVGSATERGGSTPGRSPPPRAAARDSMPTRVRLTERIHLRLRATGRSSTVWTRSRSRCSRRRLERLLSVGRPRASRPFLSARAIYGPFRELGAPDDRVGAVTFTTAPLAAEQVLLGRGLAFRRCSATDALHVGSRVDPEGVELRPCPLADGKSSKLTTAHWSP